MRNILFWNVWNGIIKNTTKLTSSFSPRLFLSFKSIKKKKQNLQLKWVKVDINHWYESIFEFIWSINSLNVRMNATKCLTTDMTLNRRPHSPTVADRHHCFCPRLFHLEVSSLIIGKKFDWTSSVPESWLPSASSTAPLLRVAFGLASNVSQTTVHTFVLLEI